MVDPGRHLRRALPADARLDRRRPRPAEHPPRRRRLLGRAAVGDERLPAGDHRLRRHRRAARRHVRPQAALPRRHGGLRARVGCLGRRRRRADADLRPGAAGDRRRADAAALAGDRLQRLSGGRAGPGARHLGGDLGAGAGDRPARRRRPGRSRLAPDLLDQPAGRGGGDRDRDLRRARSRPTRRRAARSTSPASAPSASGSPPRSWPWSRHRAWSIGRDHRPGRARGWRRSSPSGGSSTGPGADRRLRAVSQRPLLRRQRRRLRPGRRLLGGDVLPAPVPAGRARPLGRPQRGC